MILLDQPWGLLEHGTPVAMPMVTDGVLYADAAGNRWPGDPRRPSCVPVVQRGTHTLWQGAIPLGPDDRRRAFGVPRPDLPARPTEAEERSDPDAAAPGVRLMRRARRVHDRLAQVEEAARDPVNLWQRLSEAWTDPAAQDEPRMEAIVRHARDLRPVLDRLRRRPRVVLRRVHKMTPITRLREIDRKSMIWQTRQPGTTIIERAGAAQRLLSVVREEGLDTTENRVLRAQCELAWLVAGEYAARHGRHANHPRVREVRVHGRRSIMLARQLAEAGVARADPSVTPNFVLTQNPDYRAVWAAWRDLLRRRDEEDELWRWQARSWEELGALATVVAALRLPGATLIAASPLVPRPEQDLGSWIEADNPLAAVHLPGPGLVLTVRYRPRLAGRMAQGLAAPVWIAYGPEEADDGILREVAVWPMWRAGESVLPNEAEALAKVLSIREVRAARVAAGIILRHGTCALRRTAGQASAIAMGTEGAALAAGIAYLGQTLAELLEVGT